MPEDRWPKTVTTTIRPDEPVEVGAKEYDDLKALGILVDAGTTAGPVARGAGKEG